MTYLYINRYTFYVYKCIKYQSEVLIFHCYHCFNKSQTSHTTNLLLITTQIFSKHVCNMSSREKIYFFIFILNANGLI